jgi:hypothetical protein
MMATSASARCWPTFGRVTAGSPTTLRAEKASADAFSALWVVMAVAPSPAMTVPSWTMRSPSWRPWTGEVTDIVNSDGEAVPGGDRSVSLIRSATSMVSRAPRDQA